MPRLRSVPVTELISLVLVYLDNFYHKLYMDPAFDATAGVSRDEPEYGRAASIYPASWWTPTVSGP